MVNVLRAAGHDVRVCSRPHETGFARVEAELLEYGPDLVVVAYVPLGFAPRTGGIAPSFTLWSVRLRQRLRCQTVLLAHEASLPLIYFLRGREYKLAALAVAQIAQFSVLAASYDWVLFSNIGTQRAWARQLPPLAARFQTLRICSNIPYQASADPRAELSAGGHAVPTTTILFFGTGHQTVLFDYVEAAFLAVLAAEPSAELVIVGMGFDKLNQARPSLARHAKVRALGYVAAPELSLWLQVARLVLAPLLEGVNARKGTVMAALQHGRAVVTTRGPQTLDDIAWEEICVLAPLDRDAFAAKAVSTFRDPKTSDSVGRAAQAEYEAHASATVTAHRILDCADQIV